MDDRIADEVEEGIGVADAVELDVVIANETVVGFATDEVGVIGDTGVVHVDIAATDAGF